MASSNIVTLGTPAQASTSKSSSSSRRSSGKRPSALILTLDEPQPKVTIGEDVETNQPTVLNVSVFLYMYLN